MAIEETDTEGRQLPRPHPIHHLIRKAVEAAAGAAVQAAVTWVGSALIQLAIWWITHK